MRPDRVKIYRFSVPHPRWEPKHPGRVLFIILCVGLLILL